MERERKVIGIDFGSTQSSIAIMEIGSTGIPELLNVGGGRRGVTIPTLLALDQNVDTVKASGNKAKALLREEGENTNTRFVYNFKRDLGEKNANSYCRLYLKELANNVKQRYNVKELDPQDFVTCFAYPATWSKDKQELLKKMIVEAGFPSDSNSSCGVYSIPEPVAAMHSLRNQDKIGFKFGNKPEYYMVIDFGGGTLDICIIKTDLLGSTPEIISTSGDGQLGGKEFDDIFEHHFFRKNQDLKKSLFSSAEIADLREKIKEAKEAFSENIPYTDCFKYPLHLFRGEYLFEMTKNEFENICEADKIFDKIRESIREAIKKADIEIDSIQKVILTGGSSKWYFLKEIVAKEFGLGVNSIFLTDTPFTDVANGCATKKGRSSEPAQKEGYWIQYIIEKKGKKKGNGSEKWSPLKRIVDPGRNAFAEPQPVFLDLVKTRYFIPYKVHIKIWRGFDESKLTCDNEDGAVFEFYARTNFPIAKRFVRGYNAITKLGKIEEFEDEYKIYLIPVEDSNGIHFEIEINDRKASISIKESNNLNNTNGVVKTEGKIQRGRIIPGFISTCSLEGLNPRHLHKLKTRKKKNENDKNL